MARDPLAEVAAELGVIDPRSRPAPPLGWENLFRCSVR